MYTSFSVSLLRDSVPVKDEFYSSSHKTAELLAIHPDFFLCSRADDYITVEKK